MRLKSEDNDPKIKPIQGREWLHKVHVLYSKQIGCYTCKRMQGKINLNVTFNLSFKFKALYFDKGNITWIKKALHFDKGNITWIKGKISIYMNPYWLIVQWPVCILAILCITLWWPRTAEMCSKSSANKNNDYVSIEWFIREFVLLERARACVCACAHVLV
jgi:hypothetical protein